MQIQSFPQPDLLFCFPPSFVVAEINCRWRKNIKIALSSRAHYNFQGQQQQLLQQQQQ